MSLRPQTALVTGATSGIGAAFAGLLAARGFDLILTGRREEKIRALAAELRDRHGTAVEVVLAELSVRGDLSRLAELSVRREVTFLVNNAGFGLGNTFAGGSLESQEAMERVHVGAALRLVHACLPAMRRDGGAIVNVASLAGLFPLPGSVVYCASKAFLISFSQALAMELAGQGIRVQALCPGLTRSDFHERLGPGPADSVRGRRLLWMEAGEVARRSLACLERGRVVCIPGLANRALALLRHLPRGLYLPLASRVAR